MPDMFADLNPPYATIVADPPWRYDGVVAVGAGGRAAEYAKTKQQLGASDHYSTMSTDEIAGLPVADLAADNAHLYLWTTNSFMEDAHTIARAWGFSPKTILTWVKTKEDGTVSMKTGYYFRGATEHALFCVRGSLPLHAEMALPTAHLWRRIGEHSRKPEAFLDLVEQASPGPYVELFCRRPRFGWDTWGHGYEGVLSGGAA